MGTTALRGFLDFAVGAAMKAGEAVMAHYQSGVAVEQKADRSPVTPADREAERLLRGLIAREYPGHAVLGEEFGLEGDEAAPRWILDPIDGTRNFVQGVPIFGVLVGLEIEGEVAVGVAHFPALRDTLSAARGLGCHWNGRAARVSEVSRLEDACVVYTDVVALRQRMGDRWLDLEGRARMLRGWGDCYGHCLVATGRAEAMLDPKMSAWDCAALFPIVREAGGAFTDWKGTPTIYGPDAVSTNGILHSTLLAYTDDADVARRR